jgi:hypothetical protein
VKNDDFHTTIGLGATDGRTLMDPSNKHALTLHKSIASRRRLSLAVFVNTQDLNIAQQN